MWVFFLQMLSLHDDECLVVATGVSANLLLEFSPSPRCVRILNIQMCIIRIRIYMHLFTYQVAIAYGSYGSHTHTHTHTHTHREDGS